MAATFFQMAKDTTPLSLSSNFVLPEDQRPHLSDVTRLDSIPIIDMNEDDGKSDSDDHELILDRQPFFCLSHPEQSRAFLKFIVFMATTFFQMANDTTPLSLSSNFVLPEDKRPVLSAVTRLDSIPVIDMNGDGKSDSEQDGPSSLIVKKISQACEEYGFFQIINHGVPDELCQRMMCAVTDFFHLPPEERAQYLRDDNGAKPTRINNYHLKVEGEDRVSMWSEVLRHPWHPVDHLAHLLPESPPQYQEVAAEYWKEMGALASRLLSLISQGLGLDKDCLQKRIGENPRLFQQANYYPPCPDPELTLGLNVHTDLVALTILRQSESVTGLQVLKDDKYIAVDPLPNSFVINLGDQIQVLSNGRYKSVHHRAVTNKDMPRLSLATFYAPNGNTIIGPIEDLIDEDHPAIYRKYSYAEFLE